MFPSLRGTETKGDRESERVGWVGGGGGGWGEARDRDKGRQRERERVDLTLLAYSIFQKIETLTEHCPDAEIMFVRFRGFF